MFFVVAILIYLPGIGWGIPPELIRGRTHSWASDELGDAVLSQIHTTISGVGRYNPQYPLFGYIVQAVPVAPYVLVAGRAMEPGTANPGRVLRMETLLARSTSVVLAAALVVVAMRTSAVLWGPADAWIAGSLTMLLYPMFYYGRTSNVDLPALFFTGVALWQYAICLRQRLNQRTALLLAGSAALAVATKDASYGALLPAGVVVAVLNWRTERRLVLVAAAVAAGTYLVASGAILNGARYLLHIRFIRFGSTRHYHFYYGSTRAYAPVLADTLGLVTEAMGLPLALLALAGLFLSARRDQRIWLWLLPPIGIVVLTILPVRYVLYRFVFISAYCLTFFAAFALSSTVLTRPRVRHAAVALVCGWSLLRGADLTWQMRHDSRYEAGEWFRRNARPGDRVGYYGTEPNKLPFLSSDVAIVPGPSRLPVSDPPEFLITMPWQVYESAHEYNLPEETYAALRAGTSGYRQLLALKTPALFPSKQGSFVNPPVTVFVRGDRAESLEEGRPKFQGPE